MSVEIRFIQQNGIEDNIVRWVTRSRWTHCEIVLPNNKGFISSYVPQGVAIMPLDYCKPNYQATGTVECDDTTTEKILTWANSKIKTPYDYWAIAGDLFGTNWTSKKAFDCSAFCFTAFKQAGIMLLDLPYVKWVNPGQLASSPEIIFENGGAQFWIFQK